MNNVYDIFNETKIEQNQTEKKPQLSKKEYAEMMKEKRQALFTMANEQTFKAVADPEAYLQYLKLQSSLDYTVTNTLLVMAQAPQSTMLKDYSNWRKTNKYVSKGAKGISILEPGSEFRRKDGSIGMNYNPKTVFDISQLSGKGSLPPLPTKYDIKELVGAIVHHVAIKPTVVSAESQMPQDVYFDMEQNELYVKQGLEPKAMLTGLIREYCYIECAEQFNTRNEARFTAESAAYMIAQKFGLDNYNTSFANNIYGYFEGKEQKDSKDIKGELENIKNIKDSIGERMEHGIFVQQQNRQEKQADRNAR